VIQSGWFPRATATYPSPAASSELVPSHPSPPLSTSLTKRAVGYKSGCENHPTRRIREASTGIRGGLQAYYTGD
jgi:hypothetical protein